VPILQLEGCTVLSPGKTESAVLLCGNDEKLLHYRGLVLERARFHAERALTSAEAAEWLRVKRFRLAVLCHTLPDSTRQALQILCWQARVPVFDLPVLLTPEELIRAVTVKARTRI
jgi:DNA-binding response OmpR family regulator